MPLHGYNTNKARGKCSSFSLLHPPTRRFHRVHCLRKRLSLPLSHPTRAAATAKRARGRRVAARRRCGNECQRHGGGGSGDWRRLCWERGTGNQSIHNVGDRRQRMAPRSIAVITVGRWKPHSQRLLTAVLADDTGGHKFAVVCLIAGRTTQRQIWRGGSWRNGAILQHPISTSNRSGT